VNKSDSQQIGPEVVLESISCGACIWINGVDSINLDLFSLLASYMRGELHALGVVASCWRQPRRTRSCAWCVRPEHTDQAACVRARVDLGSRCAWALL
jgi:hypothetical protein